MMLLIFTDLDGTLLNADDYRYDSALPVIQQLQAYQIPVIPVTSKTRCEVECLCEEIGLRDSFIVENGSGIFIPETDQKLAQSDSQTSGGYGLKLLGCSYAEARQGLKQLANAIKHPLKGFADLSETELMQLTGLTTVAVKRAKNREFTEPFITPKNIDPAIIETTVQQLGFQMVIGDRFSHLMGQNAGKGKAVQWLVEQYQRCFPNVTIQTLGLGNSPNDLAMLQAVDLPIIVPGKQGPHPSLNDFGWHVASAPGSQGWANEVQSMIRHL